MLLCVWLHWATVHYGGWIALPQWVHINPIAHSPISVTVTQTGGQQERPDYGAGHQTLVCILHHIANIYSVVRLCREQWQWSHSRATHHSEPVPKTLLTFQDIQQDYRGCMKHINIGDISELPESTHSTVILAFQPLSESKVTLQTFPRKTFPTLRLIAECIVEGMKLCVNSKPFNEPTLYSCCYFIFSPLWTAVRMLECCVCSLFW